MKFGKETMLLYAVTDRAWTGETTLYDQVECALKAAPPAYSFGKNLFARRIFLWRLSV